MAPADSRFREQRHHRDRVNGGNHRDALPHDAAY
jgi:hypothetical protein